MKYTAITKGSFLSRPNRFLAQVLIGDREETVHVKNTGRCRELLLPGAQVYLEKAASPDRKTAYDLIGVYKKGLGLVNMDSQAPNAVVREWLEQQSCGMAPKEAAIFEKPEQIRPEYTFGRSRIDFYFENRGRKCLMEVKGVTLEREHIAYFPDAPTERGIKHMEELEAALEQGYECYLAFVIQMPGILEVYPNEETHPAFGEALRRANRSGVRILALGCCVGENCLSIERVREMRYLQCRPDTGRCC